MISSSSVGSAGSVRNSRAPARMAFRIKPLSVLRLAGRTIAPRIGLRQFLDQLDGLVGSWSRTTIVRCAAISVARVAAS